MTIIDVNYEDVTKCVIDAEDEAQVLAFCSVVNGFFAIA